MKQFNFNGDWKFEINLTEFIESNSKWNEHLNSYQPSKDSPIKIKIIDFRDFEPDPLKEQIETIQYIQENGKLILEALFNQFDIVNKTHGDSFGEHDWYHNINELGELFLIREIEVFTEHKDGQAYFQLNGEYKGDPEHGLIVAMHKNRLIGFDAIGEDTYKEVYEDLGAEGLTLKEYASKHRYPRKEEMHAPLPKYGKFKPWQLYDTADYFERVLREKKNKQLIQELESNNWNLNLRFPNLGKNILDIAAYMNNVEMIQYFIKRNADPSLALDQCIYKGSFSKESIIALISNGVSIDTIGNYNYTPLGFEINNFVRTYYSIALHDKIDFNNGLPPKNEEKQIAQIEAYKNKIKFFYELGADPTKCDTSGNSYIDLAKKLLDNEAIEKYKVVNQLDRCFIKKKKKRSWKFWKN